MKAKNNLVMHGNVIHYYLTQLRFWGTYQKLILFSVFYCVFSLTFSQHWPSLWEGFPAGPTVPEPGSAEEQAARAVAECRGLRWTSSHSAFFILPGKETGGWDWYITESPFKTPLHTDSSLCRWVVSFQLWRFGKMTQNFSLPRKHKLE